MSSSLSSPLIYVAVGAALWLLGLAGLLLAAHPLRRIIAINVMGSGVFLVLVAQSRGDQDPVLQALVVTGLVVAVSATAFALRLATSDPGSSAPRGKPEEEP